jgi:transposase
VILMLKQVTNFVGIDISKLTVDISIVKKSHEDNIQHIKLTNDLDGFKSLRKHLNSLGVRINSRTLIICESMGNYSKPLLDYFINKKALLCIESALRIKRSLGIQRGKNDKIDSERIAFYAIRHLNSLTLYSQPRREIVLVQHLLRARQRLIVTKIMLKKPLSEIENYYKAKEVRVLANINKPALFGIDESLNKLETELKGVANKDPKIKHQLELLTSIPGVGEIVALHFICYTNEFTRCSTGKQLACYVGVAPFKYTSGTSLNAPARVSHLGNRMLKSILHMPAVGQAYGKKDLHKYFDRKVAQGKHKMSVLNAIKNKLVLRMVAVIRNDRPFQAS